MPSKLKPQRTSLWSVFQQSGRWSKARRWILVVVALAIVAGIGVGTSLGIEHVMKEHLKEQLKAILEAEVKALKLWYRNQDDVVTLGVQLPDIQEAIAALVHINKEHPNSQTELIQAEALQKLREYLSPFCRWEKDQPYISYAVLDLDFQVIGGLYDEPIGTKAKTAIPEKSMEKLLKGETVVTRPFVCPIPILNSEGMALEKQGAIFVIAPVREYPSVKKEDNPVIAYLGFRIDPETEFTKILSVAQFGETGETYAFDSEGVMISRSLFDEKLQKIGLLKKGESSVLNLRLADPGANLDAGERPAKAPHLLSLTHMAYDAINNKPELKFNLDGYRDYRGVRVIGAWKWLPELDFGVATEVDCSEAFQALYVIRWIFVGLFSLLLISVVGVILFSFVVTRMKRRIRKADLEVQTLGQYQLLERIGKGGMGVVYKAKHAFLQRPTALKILQPEHSGDRALARFEREVQMTSRLTHPNTIAVYDYGRAEDGTFYYVMEYLTGITLEDLVWRTGPQPESRVINILQQVCNSLEEAHGIGLIHRDIKAANIMLCKYGGQYDFVKVLDFGLVKDVRDQSNTGNTTSNFVIGTPLYLSPEAIAQPEKVEAGRDIYAIGVTGYFLLTGRPLFEDEHPMQLFRRHMDTPPIPPSERVGWDIDKDLEDIIMRCLEKDPSKRFMTVESLWKALNSCQRAGQWTRDEARQWWEENAQWLNLPKGTHVSQETTDVRKPETV